MRIIYTENQKKLTKNNLDKIQKFTESLNKENVIIIKAYASKRKNTGSSDARRISLSRALEVRNYLIENDFSNTNIFVKALGSQKNDDELQDAIIIQKN